MNGMHAMTLAFVVVCATNWRLVRKYDRLVRKYDRLRAAYQQLERLLACVQDRDLQAPYTPRVQNVQGNKKKKKQKAAQRGTAH
tara:strand:+ start:253 stop:504 length:252 start_codon:yes stop_codon:yes gene_type:complete